MKIDKQSFGKTTNGLDVDLYTLTNAHGLQAKVTNYGGIIVSLLAPDRQGKFNDIVLGYDDLASYEKDETYFGAIIGRCANRIAKGEFTLGGIEYKLAQNNDGNHLHGGARGFNKRVWQAEPFENTASSALKLVHLSKDKEEGYPGNLAVTVTYTLTNSDELKIEYAATTDEETIVNLTNHSYFNLKGTGDVLQHEVMIHADRFTPVDSTLIPTGELRRVKDTPFDFTHRTGIGSRIAQADEQLIIAKGYDHNFVLNKPAPATTALAAEVYEPTSGRVMQMLTTEPGVQFYTGNFLNNVQGKARQIYAQRGGLCLEAQHFPDSPNKPAFPSVMLKPVEEYAQTTIYKFSAK